MKHLAGLAQCRYVRAVTLTLPDLPAVTRMTEAELRLELACFLFAQGKIGKVGGADLAGVDFFEFQRALGERRISSLTVADLHDDIDTLNRLFPEKPIATSKA